MRCPLAAAGKRTDKRSKAMKKIYLETLGCAKNRVDSEIMLTALEREGYGITVTPEEAQVIIVNTCAFLTAASEESINRILALSDLKSTGQCEKLVCAGCLSVRYRESLLEEIPELDGLLGSSNFEQIPQLLNDLYAGRESRIVRVLQKPHYEHHELRERRHSTPAQYAYVKVSEGCSNMCSFCNIPFLRGYFSSRRIAPIIEEILGKVESGVREINLISQDLSSYGVDLKDGANLQSLLEAINLIPGRFWVRLFYAYPNTFDTGVLAAMAQSPHIVPYVDMPFQHISSTVLRDMNRRISESQIREKLLQLREAVPEMAIRTTFITGFPTETETDFEQLRDFVQEGWFDHVGVFSYSHEDNIHAARYGDPVPNQVKRARRKALLAAQQAVSQRRNQARVGQQLEVLVEGVSTESDLLLQGRTMFQGPEVDGITLINEGQALEGQFHTVEITEAHIYDLVGRIVSAPTFQDPESVQPVFGS